MTLSVLAAILARPLAGAVTWCKASSTRTSTIGFPAVTIVLSATNHLETVPSGKMLDAESASSTLISLHRDLLLLQRLTRQTVCLRHIKAGDGLEGDCWIREPGQR
jgi:hypothetical protein